MMGRERMVRSGLVVGMFVVLSAGCRDDDANNATPAGDMSVAADMSVAPADMRADTGGGEPDASDEDMAPDVSDEEMGAVGLGIPDGCNPIAFEHDCLFPYPSNVFLKQDATTLSGHRVELSEAARPRVREGTTFDFMEVHPTDGFSHHQPIVAYFKQGLSDDGLTFHTDDPAATLSAANSATLLIRTDTGELVAHWAEVDRLADRANLQTLLIRTFKNLDFETRYIVVVQGLKGSDGERVEAPQGFRQLRDGVDDPALVGERERYERDIFPALETLGVNRQNLQLAWDFTTQSKESVSRDLVAMRDDLMVKLRETPPVVTVTQVIDAPSEQIALRLEGTIRVPLYLEADILFPALNRNAAGEVVANGAHEVPFTLQVPRSAMPQEGSGEPYVPARLMQYGHGFFGAREEINYSFMRGYSDEQRYVTASVDWRGMSEAELTALPTVLTRNPAEALRFITGAHQGIINFIALSHALKTSIAELAELKRDGVLLYEPAHLYYYGISQGHILGAAFLALSPHVERGVMGVGGAPFSFMMSRSNNFATFVFLLRSTMGNYLDVQRFITLSQHSFDRIDPSTYSARLLRDQFEDVPLERKLLMHYGYWDHSVPILAGEIFARNVGAPLLSPTAVLPYGFTVVEGPHDGSASVMIDYMTQDPPGFYAQLPTSAQIEEVRDGTNVHEAIRRNPRIKAQIDAFLRPDGVIEATCDGACDPE